MIQIGAMPNDNFRLRPDTTSPLTPPPVSAAFRWDRETWGHALRCVPFEASAQHLFTSKQLQLPANAIGRPDEAGLVGDRGIDGRDAR